MQGTEKARAASSKDAAGPPRDATDVSAERIPGRNDQTIGRGSAQQGRGDDDMPVPAVAYHQPLTLEAAKASPVTLGVVGLFWALSASALAFVFNEVRGVSQSMQDLSNRHTEAGRQVAVLTERLESTNRHIEYLKELLDARLDALKAAQQKTVP
jgi:hypothetical protein